MSYKFDELYVMVDCCFKTRRENKPCKTKPSVLAAAAAGAAACARPIRGAQRTKVVGRLAVKVALSLLATKGILRITGYFIFGHLRHMLALALGGHQRGRVDDLDCVRVRTVPARHLGVHLADRAVDGYVTELLVHVVGVRAALVAQPDAVIFHLRGALVENLVDSQQLAATLLGLVEFLREVPEARLGQHRVLREQPHPVDLRHLRWHPLPRHVETHELHGARQGGPILETLGCRRNYMWMRSDNGDDDGDDGDNDGDNTNHGLRGSHSVRPYGADTNKGWLEWPALIETSITQG